ncbi:MAG TPA: DUF4386 family protein [Anaerolineae bacterium]|nr:DUF4386 family protein [Anaerolineae bacterium]
MEKAMTHALTENTMSDLRYKKLYRLGGIAVLANLVVMLISFVGYILWPYAAGTTPTQEIYTLIQTNIWGAFIALDLGVSIANLISIVIFLALYVALRRVDEAYALIALIIGLVAVAAMIAARPVFEIFTLSDLYASAGTEMDKSLYLTAGESLLVQFHGAAWHISIFFNALASLINALLMRRSQVFGRALAYIGIVTFAVATLFWAPGVGLMFLFLSMLGSVPWSILLGRDLFRLAREK